MTLTLFTPAEELCDGSDLAKHVAEHNRNGNDADYQENKEHFTGQTLLVWNLLKQGETITGQRMFMEHMIQDVRPRISAIKKFLIGHPKYELIESKLPKGHGAKQWWLTEKVA